EHWSTGRQIKLRIELLALIRGIGDITRHGIVRWRARQEHSVASQSGVDVIVDHSLALHRQRFRMPAVEYPWFWRCQSQKLHCEYPARWAAQDSTVLMSPRPFGKDRRGDASKPCVDLKFRMFGKDFGFFQPIGHRG